MAWANTDDGVRLYFEEAGAGTPIVFVHEFGGDHRSWEPQMRVFRAPAPLHHLRRTRLSALRCSARRGSVFAGAVPCRTSWRSWTRRLCDRAHVVGLSMGGFAALHFGVEHRKRALDRRSRRRLWRREAVRGVLPRCLGTKSHGSSRRRAARLSPRRIHSAHPGCNSRTRIRGAGRSSPTQLGNIPRVGAANTMRGVQTPRPRSTISRTGLRTMTVPTLVIVGDEDDHCLQPGIFLKKTIPACGLLVCRKPATRSISRSPTSSTLP